MREGKNREIRNVLRALGLQVNRLIRVSFGPFQLGELPDGAVEEVKTRTLRDQLGPRLAALAGADFSSEIVEREEPRAPTLPVTLRRRATAAPRTRSGRQREGVAVQPCERSRATAGWGAPNAKARSRARAGYAGHLRMTGQRTPRRPHRDDGSKASHAGRRRTIDPKPRRAVTIANQNGAAPITANGTVDAHRRRPAARACARRRRSRRRSGRPPTGCASRCSTFSSMPTAIRSWTRGCSTCSPEPARSASRRCRAARRSCCSSMTARRRARCCAATSRRWAPAAPPSLSPRRHQAGAGAPLEPFSLAFLDPPYGKGLAEQALAAARDGGWLAPGRARRGRGGGRRRVQAAGGLRGAGAAQYDDTEFVFARVRVCGLYAFRMKSVERLRTA